MANVKITELTAATALAGTDVLPIVDVGADATKKVSVSDLLRNLPDGTASAPALAFADDQNTGVLSPGNNSLAFATSGTQRLVIDSSGNVGIGVASPARELSIGDGSGSPNIQLLASSSGNSRIEFGDSDDSDAGEIQYVHSSNYMQFTTNGSERLRIDSSGRLLHGTTSSSAAASAIFEGNSSNAAGAGVIYLNRGTSSMSAGLEMGFIRFGDQDENTGALIEAEADGTWASNDYPGRILFSTTADGGSSPTERMRIDSSGNVGIGRTSPESRLHIDSGSGNQPLVIQASGNTAAYVRFKNSADHNGYIAYNNSAFAFWTNNSERLRIDSSGNIAIGSTTSGSYSGYTVLRVNNNTNGGVVEVSNNNTIKGQFYYDGTQTRVRANLSTALALDTNDTERLRIDTSGNVGIGTASPSVRCDVRTALNDDSLSQLLVSDAGNNGGITFGAHATYQAQIAFDRPTTSLIFRERSNERMRINGFGHVLVGTSSAHNDTDLVEFEAATAISSQDVLLINGGQTGFNGTNDANTAQKIRFKACAYNANDGIQQLDTARIGFQKTGSWNTVTSAAAVSGSLIFEVASGTSASTTLTERMRIDSSGHVGIGTDSPSEIIDVIQSAQGDAATLRIRNSADSNASTNVEIVARQATRTGGRIVFGRENANSWNSAAGYASGFISFNPTNAGSDVERMRIDSAGNLLVGKTSDSFNTAGSSLKASGEVNITRNAAPPLFINRKSDDGQIISFSQDGTAEGNISVSGSTISYNGAHLSRWSQLAGGAERTEILRGSVLSNLDEMCEWGEENNEQLNRMKVSDAEGDVNVSGVFQAWDDDDDTYTNDFYCAMTGDFVIRIAQGTTVARGDLLMSAGDGTAKPQDDDIVRSKTIAKVTSTTVSATYADGSYCVPCVLMAC